MQWRNLQDCGVEGPSGKVPVIEMCVCVCVSECVCVCVRLCACVPQKGVCPRVHFLRFRSRAGGGASRAKLSP